VIQSRPKKQGLTMDNPKPKNVIHADAQECAKDLLEYLDKETKKSINWRETRQRFFERAIALTLIAARRAQEKQAQEGKNPPVKPIDEIAMSSHLQAVVWKLMRNAVAALPPESSHADILKRIDQLEPKSPFTFGAA
jgi:hypothetical protein